MTVTEILRNEHGIEAKTGKKSECPFCQKKTFSIKADDQVGKCFHPLCGKVITADNNKKKSYTPSISTATVQPRDGCTLEKYAEAKKLPLEFLKELGLQTRGYMGQQALRIPYKDKDDAEVAVRFRLELEKGEQNDNRFRWRSGCKVVPYGLWQLDKACDKGYIVIVEGESDCHTLWFHKIPALGIPGANSWKKAWAEYLKEIEKIYVVIEPDGGGEAVHNWLSKAPFRDRVHLVDLGDAEDPSQLYMSDPDNFTKGWESAIGKAIPWPEYEKLKQNARRKELWEKCATLAKQPAILDRFRSVLARRGLVGEDRVVKLVYLATTSRLLPQPISIVVKGPSSCGKSYAVQRTLDFFPESAYYALSGMSEHALAYSEEPLKHRILVIYENAGIQSDFGNYLVRSLLSEGCVRYETVEKTSEGLKARLIEREGPTGLFLTTTRITLHPENETRIVSIPVTDTSDQTKNIMRSLAHENEDIVDLSEWHAFQEWLESSDNRVLIPFAEKLAELIQPVAVRLRRDFKLLLSLIKSHAILHQVSHQRDGKGRIIATIEDYRIVRELVYDLLAEGVESSVRSTVRETVAAVDELSEDNPDGVTNVQVARKLGLDKSAAYRRVRSAMRLGYLQNLEEKRGRPAKLVLGDPIPDDIQLLPTVKDLRDCTVAEESEGVTALSLIDADDSDAEGKPYGQEGNETLSDMVTGLPDRVEDWPEEWRETYEERVAIMMEQAEMGEKKAKSLAEQSVRDVFKQRFNK